MGAIASFIEAGVLREQPDAGAGNDGRVTPC
jgi:hypothetical protein